MIPRSISRPFGRSSPQLTEVDLAKLIDRTIALAVAGHHELGFATVSVGCDGRKRTTFIDGSSCQVSGEVCVAQRQDGITSCIDTPSQGNGMTVQSITFAPVGCTPVTGWYILDSAGYLYRIPAGLLTPYTYWPPTGLPPSTTYDLLRSGTWGTLMCADEMGTPALYGFGNGIWVPVALSGGESFAYVQQFATAIGGDLAGAPTNFFTAFPSVANGVGKVTVSAFDATFAGVALSRVATDTVLNQTASNGALTAGREYRAHLYAYLVNPTTLGVGVIKGPSSLVGTATTPTLTSPSTRLSLASVLVSYGTAPTLAAMTYAVGGTVTNANAAQISRAILLRDGGQPNPGRRSIGITLPSADSGVTTGAVRVAWGYPIALEILTGSFSPGAPAEVGAPYGETVYGDTVARTMYDQAFVYPVRLGIEYSAGHLNVGGPEIATPGANGLLSALDPPGPFSRDIGANVLQLPNDEIGLILPASHRIDRYRVRPAPDAAATFAVSHQTTGAWGDDPNLWPVGYRVEVAAWTPGDTSFTALYSWPHARDMLCVLWQWTSTCRHWSQDPNALIGMLGQPVGLVCPIGIGGAGAPALVSGATRYAQILGPDLVLAYAWTFKIDGVESALSPFAALAVAYPAPTHPTYTLTVTVPLGPTGTTERTVYRFAYDQDTGNDGYTLVSPWDSRTGTRGAVYDRMFSKLATIPDNSTTTVVDTHTALAFTGERPPSPFIGPLGGGIVIAGPADKYLLPPMEL